MDSSSMAQRMHRAGDPLSVFCRALEALEVEGSPDILPLPLLQALHTAHLCEPASYGLWRLTEEGYRFLSEQQEVEEALEEVEQQEGPYLCLGSIAHRLRRASLRMAPDWHTPSEPGV